MWACWWRWSPPCSGWARRGWSGATCGPLPLLERDLVPKEGKMNQSAVGIPTEMLGLEIRPLLRRVYLWMTVGVLLTAIVALLTVTTPVLRNLLLNPLVVWGALIGELALVVVLSAAIRRLS